MAKPDSEKRVKEHIIVEERILKTLNEDADDIRQLTGGRNLSSIVNLALAHYLSLPESEREEILYSKTEDAPLEHGTKKANKHVCFDPMIYRRLREDSEERLVSFYGYLERTISHYATLPKPTRDEIIRRTRRSDVERNLQSQN